MPTPQTPHWQPPLPAMPLHAPIRLHNPHGSRLVAMANAVLAHRHMMRRPASHASLAALKERWGAK